MSYQVLARKWRPAQFAEVVGQEHVLEPLKHALEHDRLHHAYLFTGTRGVGKTTIARILAKALNCQQGVTPEPCGQCESCQQIDQGRFVDLLEIDAASRTKVEDTRELLDNVQYRPTQGRFKVYLIDEVHMLSRHSFNALLKTLEEPPEHVKFLLATTDPQKLPITVVSRCLQFNLRAMTVDLVTQQLATVLAAEKIAFEQPALPLLARAARGSMRDGLSLTDQAIAQGHGSVTLDSVQRMLGNVPQADITGLLLSVVGNDGNAAFEHLDKMASLVPDMGSILTELQALLHRLALVQQLPQLASEEEQSGNVAKLLRSLPAEVIQLYYSIVLEGRRELPYSVDERSGVEMTVLRLLAFRPVDAVNTELPESNASHPVVPQIDEPPTEVMPTETESETPSNVLADIGDLLKTREQLAQHGADAASSERVEDAALEQKKNDEETVTETRETLSTVDPEPSFTPASSAETTSLPALTPDIRRAEQVDDWSALIAATELNGLARQLLLNTNLIKIADRQWQILVAPAQQSLLSEVTEQRVRESLAQVLAEDGRFQFVVEEPRQPTPLQIQQHIDAYQHQLAVQWVHNDSGVAELKQRFAAEVDEKSITAV